jgi:hypothetical protein
MKLSLKDVTLVMIETQRHQLAKLAVEDCLRHADFGDVVICANQFNELRFSGASHVEVEDFSSKTDLNEYLWYGLPPLIKTAHALLIQWDSWIIDPTMWRNQFLSFDYIGAPWPWHEDGFNVGNSGFSLRSKRLMDFLVANRDQFLFNTQPEDILLSRIYRRSLEKAGNFLWAPERDALDFSFEWWPKSNATKFDFEHAAAPERHFGFHGTFNWPHLLDRDRLIERFEIAERSEYIRYTGMLNGVLKAAPWLKELPR